MNKTKIKIAYSIKTSEGFFFSDTTDADIPSHRVKDGVPDLSSWERNWLAIEDIEGNEAYVDVAHCFDWNTLQTTVLAVEIQEEPEFDLIAHLKRQFAFSEKAFGPSTSTEGIKKHILSELEEIKKDPSDIYEWVDVLILAIDAARREGQTVEEVSKWFESPDKEMVLNNGIQEIQTRLNHSSPSWRDIAGSAMAGALAFGIGIKPVLNALSEKQAINEARKWPDWKSVPAGQPIFHEKESA